MSWRPEDWKNPYYDNRYVFDHEFEDYEAGADAMLEALRNTVEDGSFKHIDEAYKTDTGFYDSPYGCYLCKGRVVFIPDEEDEVS